MQTKEILRALLVSIVICGAQLSLADEPPSQNDLMGYQYTEPLEPPPNLSMPLFAPGPTYAEGCRSMDLVFLIDTTASMAIDPPPPYPPTASWLRSQITQIADCAASGTGGNIRFGLLHFVDNMVSNCREAPKTSHSEAPETQPL